MIAAKAPRAVVWLFALLAASGALSQESGAPLYAPEDLMFLSHMIVHHEQALELTALVPARSKREEFLRFARYLEGAQQTEIDHMRGMLELAEERGLTIPHHEMHGDPPMAGMLSKAQMAAIRAASGVEFERLWLEGMILHHEGAVAMALREQQRSFETGRRPYGIDTMLDEILVVQRAEITKMRGWVREWR
jgi:uncharacterized protein (DUF305 family)